MRSSSPCYFTNVKVKTILYIILFPTTGLLAAVVHTRVYSDSATCVTTIGQMLEVLMCPFIRNPFSWIFNSHLVYKEVRFRQFICVEVEVSVIAHTRPSHDGWCLGTNETRRWPCNSTLHSTLEGSMQFRL